SKGRMQLIRLDTKDHPQLKDKQLSILKQQIWNFPFMVVLVVRKETNFIPKGDFILTEEDHIYIMINRNDIKKLLATLQPVKNKNKKVIIMGGEQIAVNVAEKLEDIYSNVVIIETSQARCEEISEQLDSTIVIKGDATELSLLLEEGIQDTDMFIAAGIDDKKNLLASILAKNNGAKKTICLMKRPDYVSLINQLGIDHIVAPRVSVSNEIIQHVRGGNITSFYALPETNIEIVEQEITKECALTKNKLKNITIPSSLIIGGIIKQNNNTLIPSGDYKCSVKDKVVIFAREHSQKDIEELID
ncbi:MAG: NAD-binding protein, partial [Candidatus Margulisbacteria bacterium]|nr:NAD-binding protein [Candidatus Margulisiibacteriota bacterium]